MSIRTIDIAEEEAGERIDIFLVGKTGITRSQIQKRIEKGDVLVNSKPVNQHYRIKSNDSISVAEIKEKGEELIQENIPVTIFYRDESIIVVDNVRAWSYIRLRVTVRNADERGCIPLRKTCGHGRAACGRGLYTGSIRIHRG